MLGPLPPFFIRRSRKSIDISLAIETPRLQITGLAAGLGEGPLLSYLTSEIAHFSVTLVFLFDLKFSFMNIIYKGKEKINHIIRNKEKYPLQGWGK